MGMFNEVYANCPDCGKRCEAQIREMVDGFGEFDLEDPDDLQSRLDEEQLLKLARETKELLFCCDDCKSGFFFFEKEKSLARTLFP